MGNPTKYEPALFAAILERLSNGEPLAAICRDIGIARDTVRSWCREDKALDERFREARLLGADAIADECLQIADTPMVGVTVTTDVDGVKRVEEDMLGHRRLQVETRLKLLAKWFPQQYGDKIETKHTGSLTLESLVTGAAKPE